MLSYIRTQSTRILKAFSYSKDGLATTLKTEAAVQQWAAIAVITIPLGLWLGQGGVEKAMLVGTVFFVVIVELINTAIEAVVDRISEERHPLSKLAKDIGSATVLLAALNAIVVWTLVLIY